MVGLSEVRPEARRIHFRQDVANLLVRWEGVGLEHIEVRDAMGRTVMTEAASNGAAVMDLAPLAAGCYVWRGTGAFSVEAAGRFFVP